MFTPSQHDVRAFFCEARRKQLAALPLSPIESIAEAWIARHPEYHTELDNAPAALAADYRVEDGRTNPFLHLSMHLTIEEQVSIDQPRGIRTAVQQLAARHGDLHAAHHAVMDCLGEMIWASQRSGQPPDALRYLDCVQRRMSRIPGLPMGRA